jgi:hypothetical protein
MIVNTGWSGGAGGLETADFGAYLFERSMDAVDTMIE